MPSPYKPLRQRTIENHLLDASGLLLFRSMHETISPHEKAVNEKVRKHIHSALAMIANTRKETNS